jgi:hypothetical protein
MEYELTMWFIAVGMLGFSCGMVTHMIVSAAQKPKPDPAERLLNYLFDLDDEQVRAINAVLNERLERAARMNQTEEDNNDA